MPTIQWVGGGREWNHKYKMITQGGSVLRETHAQGNEEGQRSCLWPSPRGGRVGVAFHQRGPPLFILIHSSLYYTWRSGWHLATNIRLNNTSCHLKVNAFRHHCVMIKYRGLLVPSGRLMKIWHSWCLMLRDGVWSQLTPYSLLLPLRMLLKHL